MKRKKGFTLVETLAVIVILAIIALIATPVVLNIILKVRKAAFTRSAENILKAGNTFYMELQLEKIKGEVKFECKNHECISERKDNNDKNLNLNVEGDMGEGYVLVTNDGDIEFQLEKGNWCATKYINKDKIFVYDNKCGEIINDYEKPVIDKVNYTKTTKSITIVVNAHADSGISYYEYSIDGGKTYTEKQENNTYTFNNLTSDKEYEIKVRVYNGTYGKDNYDEETGMNESEIIKVTLNQLPLPIITITNETTWQKSKNVTINYGNTQGTIGSYSIDGGDTWVQGNNLIVEENNKTIIAKTTDGKNTVTISHLVTHIDRIIPNNITLNINEDSTYTKTKEITITLQDEQSGLQEGSIKYGWSESNTVEPTEYTNVNIDENTTTIKANGTNLTGSYYLWVVPVSYKDKAGNSNTTTVISSGTFNFDNQKPILTLGTITTKEKRLIIPITENTDEHSGIKETTCVAGTSTSNYNIEGTIENNICTISGLDASTKYYYKVTSTDDALNSTEKTGNMATIAPETSINPAPSGTRGLLAVVYYNPTTGSGCTESDYNTNLQNHINAGNPTVTNLKSGCMKWYVYKDNGDTYSMILDHNTTAVFLSYASGDSLLNDINSQLAKDTIGWTPSGYLPYIWDLVAATSVSSDFVLSSYDNYAFGGSYGLASKYSWLNDNTYGCAVVGCNSEDQNQYYYSNYGMSNVSGYRTSAITPRVWTVGIGALESGGGGNMVQGIRPVITVSKDKLSS